MKKGRQEPKRHLAAELAAAILEGAYRPGEWLRQIDLEETFDAKRFAAPHRRIGSQSFNRRTRP